MKNYTIGIDVGTTTVKALLVDENGKSVLSARCEYTTSYPRPGWAEQNPDDWWKAACFVTKEILGKVHCPADSIKAVSVSSQAPTMIAVNGAGEPVYPAIIWMDRRCDDFCEVIEREIGREEYLRIVGNNIDPFYVLPKILWFKNRCPDAYRETKKILQVNGFINYRLTGIFSMDRTHTMLIGAYDYQNGVWSDRILHAPGIDVEEELFPAIFDNDQIIGTVTKNAAFETGLPEGVPVVAGTVDGAAAATEAGIIREGDMVEMTGTSSVVLLSSAKPMINASLTYMFHQVPGQILTLGCMSSTGASLQWFRNLLRQVGQPDLDYGQINAIIAREAAQPTGLCFLPYMAGERAPIWDTNAKGTWLGMTLNTNLGQMLRSIMEGSAFAMRDNIECAIGKEKPIKYLRCTGGHTQSDVWMQIKASVLDMPIEIIEGGEGAPWGAAILGGLAVGLYPSAEQIIKENLTISKVVEPRNDWKEIYDELYPIYKKTYASLKNLYKDVHRIQSLNSND